MARPFWRGAPPPQSLLPLLSPTEFSRTFEAERVRTERTGSVFAVVTVNLRHKRAGELERAVEALQATMRLYDSIGELGAQTVAALLPETDPDGARAFGDRLLLALGQANISADLSVYSYPIDWEDEDLDDEGPNAGQGPHTRPRLPRAGSHGIFALCKDSGAEGDLEPFMTQSLSPLRRAVDIAVASSVLLVGSVTILPLVSLAILLDSPKGGVFFKQKRMGLGGREFDFWKFRSMRPNAEAVRAELEDDNEQSGPVFKIRNDPRMTRVGRFLRKTSLDESPQ
ncbi:MAG: sugar transferase, partial [Planctomycetota bacterium]|nr:sugar transferase [Planctomycetota bacterium]